MLGLADGETFSERLCFMPGDALGLWQPADEQLLLADNYGPPVREPLNDLTSDSRAKIDDRTYSTT